MKLFLIFIIIIAGTMVILPIIQFLRDFISYGQTLYVITLMLAIIMIVSVVIFGITMLLNS